MNNDATAHRIVTNAINQLAMKRKVPATRIYAAIRDNDAAVVRDMEELLECGIAAAVGRREQCVDLVYC